MTRDRKTTAVHRTGYADEIINILKGKAMREGFPQYREMINEKFGLDLTTRQIRYFYNNYVKPKEVVTPKEAQEAIEERQEMINVFEEQNVMYKWQKERMIKILKIHWIDVYNRLPEDSNHDPLDVMVEVKRMKRDELNQLRRHNDDIKETKQDLDLMQKEPEKFEIKMEEEVDVNLSDLDKEEIRSIALDQAGVGDLARDEG